MNLRLLGNSPCIEAGATNLVTTPIDLDGNPRVIGCRVDMGAYESLVSTDTDCDGIPDWWEALHYGGHTNAVASALSSNGVNTILEAWIAGLTPTSPASFFTLNGISNAAMTQSILRIDQTFTDRVYQLSVSSNLLRSPKLWINARTLRTGTGANLDFVVTNTWTDAIYRVNVRMK